MRIFFGILFLFIGFSSCNSLKVKTIESGRSDTIEFTYLYSEALKNRMLGYDEKAINQFIQCLSMHPESSASAYQLSEIYFTQKAYDEAKKYADFCLSRRQNNEWYLLNRAKVAKQLKEIDKVSEIYKKLVKLYPNNISYAYELAILYYENKKYDESRQILNSIEEVTGVDENVSFLRNNINYELKNYDAILSELYKLKVFYPDSIKYMDMLADFYLNFNMPDKALNLYKDILTINNENISAVYGLAWIYAKTNQFRIGFSYLLEVLKNEFFEIKRKEKLAELYLDSPPNSFTDEDIIRIYALLTDNNDVNVDFVNDYLAFLYQIKRITQAEKIAKSSIKSNPENYWAWDYLFNILLSQERFDELNSYAIKSLEYFPNQAQVYFYCGYSNFVLKRFNEAINYFETGINYVIDNKDLMQQFVLCLAESYHNVGKHARSDSYFDKYLENDSTNAYLLNNYAYYLTIRDTKLDNAERLSRKSIEIEPFNSIFLDTYSLVLYHKKEYTKALNYIQRSYLYGGNKNAVIIEHYGDILEKNGNTNEAIEKWKEAYSQNSNNKILLEKINRYNQEN
jgi:tetratricopeptide (TPR) repeat protein